MSFTLAHSDLSRPVFLISVKLIRSVLYNSAAECVKCVAALIKSSPKLTSD